MTENPHALVMVPEGDASGAAARIERLRMLEDVIRAGEAQALEARWKSGRELLELRAGHPKLPPGILAQLQISKSEAGYRMRFAEAYSEEQLATAVANGGTNWTTLRNNLPKRGRAPSRPPRPEAFPSSKTDRKEADRVEELIAKPGVRAELLEREGMERKARAARAVIERRERDEARRQREEDQQNRQIDQALRHQLVRGETTWEEITEQLEIWTDGVRRWLQLLEGLAVPNPVRMKRLEDQMGQLQQALYELRQRMFPDHRPPPAGDLDRGGVIDL